jgi:menaquinol-cytochrome c reductase iron-sulfur subunit
VLNLTRKLVSREGFMALFIASVGGLGGLITIPIVGYVFAPLINQPRAVWQRVKFAGGPNKGQSVTVDSIPIGATLEVSFLALDPLQWAGTTAIQAAWLRRTSSTSFIAFAVYCTHLGCPIHWLNQARIFLCPCHGSVFNADGTVAGGPAPRPLFTYQVRVRNGNVEIQTHPLPVAT